MSTTPYITGFCGIGNHERCPAVITHTNGRSWDCGCICHQVASAVPPVAAPVSSAVVVSVSDRLRQVLARYAS